MTGRTFSPLTRLDGCRDAGGDFRWVREVERGAVGLRTFRTSSTVVKAPERGLQSLVLVRFS